MKIYLQYLIQSLRQSWFEITWMEYTRSVVSNQFVEGCEGPAIFFLGKKKKSERINKSIQKTSPYKNEAKKDSNK